MAKKLEETKPAEFTGRISIKPYSDPNIENMGLENYGEVVFPGTAQVETLACIEQNGKLRYMNGLNEFAPEVKQIKNPEEKAAVIRQIRETIVLLERERAYNTKLDVEDKNFWEHVEMFSPNNHEIWGKIELRLGNDEILLDPKNNLDHVMLIKAIEANGFSLVANSLQEAKINGKKWFLDKQIETISATVSVVKLKNKALAKLQEIYEEAPRKLFYIAKDIEANSYMYNNSTLPDTLYEAMDSFINGLSFDSDKRRCANAFLQSSDLTVEDLKIKAIVKDANFFKFIINKADGIMYEADQNIALGRSVAEIIQYLKNPQNTDVLDILMAKVENVWKS